jgi:fumarylacetoacetase
MTDETHDPKLRSWVDSANLPETDFPIQNLPFGVFRRRHSGEVPRIGVAIGDQILDLAGCRNAGLLQELPLELREAVSAGVLNPLMSLGQASARQLRMHLSRMLRVGSVAARPEVLLPMAQAELLLPANIGGYTDFYASLFHASNVGRLFRPTAPLFPNYKYVPIGYGGRSSSIVVSGTPVQRPWGQVKPPDAEFPKYQPSSRLDYELEIGAFVGMGNDQGTPVELENAESHIFGLCLLNDWSARDIQAWEAQPLGPFLAKNFASTISPWVVTMQALEPFRAPPFERPAGDPQPLPYLSSQQNQSWGGFDITVEVWLRTRGMCAENIAPVRLSRGSFCDMYWTFAQMLTHHTSNGCNLRPGDLLGSGTISGSRPDSLGCLLELTAGGTRVIEMPDGSRRSFLEDGDEVIFRAFCEREGFLRIGFGECRGRVLGKNVRNGPTQIPCSPTAVSQNTKEGARVRPGSVSRR